MRDKLREVTIKLSVFVKEDVDEGGFRLDAADKTALSEAVEDKLKTIRNNYYYDDFEVLGVSVAKIK